MAIGIFKSLEFGGINSADYGVYITGEAVYNAPERAVEQVDIPGRNGAFLMDLGRFENIEVTYPCGIPGDDQTDFAEKISEFRNAILSKRGYQRLTDEYNPSEYRMASYVSGMEVEAVEGQQGTVGEFELTFNCKPQRWLTSGETSVTVADGETLTNPTLFDSEPLLEVEGYGTIGFNGYEVEIENALMGTVEVVRGEAMSYISGTGSPNCESNAIPTAKYSNVGDDFTALINVGINAGAPSSADVQSMTVTTQSESGTATIVKSQTSNTAFFIIEGATLTGTIGTNASTTVTAVGQVVYIASKQTRTATITITASINYDASTNKVSTAITAEGTLGYATIRFRRSELNSFTIESTKSILGDPTYIDCEIGECYRYEDGAIVSLNQYIDLGSDLPKLAPEENTFTIDQTITELKVIPRWWKV